MAVQRGYLAVVGSGKSIRLLGGRTASSTKKAALARATAYANKNPGSGKGVMVVTLRRVKILRRPAKK